MPVDIILPCLDERDALAAVLSRVPPHCRAIVVDNGSSDGSGEWAAAHGATVVDEPVRGFGSAAHRGLLAATADIVAFCDADGSLDLAELDRVCRPVIAGEADLVLGRRRPASGRAWPVHARVANAALTARLRALTGLTLRDLGPMRAARRADLLALGLTDRRSGYPLEMVLRASEAGWRIREVDVTYRPRIGRSKVTGTVRGTFSAVADMSRLLHEARA
ncbi:glycosyltransferase [Microbacterium mangrovi]|uniref:Glycosyltransferase n=1 Tax=Microbacterium mangrovi TaxID=1348253 RepID=A0A0B2A9A7_9MICO|nr:glycosyltransferase family 2 protein [Microbacterium mangrovi]KHK98283.1 glycosyltransferase [Microbacterium mangrovi]